MKDTSVMLLKCCYIFHLFLFSCSYSSVEFIHGASSDAMHTVCDSLCSVDRHRCPSDHFSINRTTQAYSPVIGPGPASVSMVTRGHPLSPPGVVQWADEFGICAQCKDQPTQIQSTPLSLLQPFTFSTYIHTHTQGAFSNILFQNNILFSPNLQSVRPEPQFNRLG